MKHRTWWIVVNLSLIALAVLLIATVPVHGEGKCNAHHPCPTPTPVPTATPAPTPTAAPTPTPSPGLPTIPPQYGTLLRKVFTDGTLTPFQVLTYPDDHIGQPGQYMTVYNRFTNGAAQTSVHDGYLDLRTTKRADGLWDAALLGTSVSGNGQTFGYGVYRFWMRWNVTPGGWQAGWLYDTTNWGPNEVDFPEMLENQSLTAHVLGQGAGARYGIPIPPDLGTVFHEFRIERRASFVAFAIDGTEVFRVTASEPSTLMAVLADTAVGFPWGYPPPSNALPWLHVAAITVDP